MHLFQMKWADVEVFHGRCNSIRSETLWHTTIYGTADCRSPHTAVYGGSGMEYPVLYQNLYAAPQLFGSKKQWTLYFKTLYNGNRQTWTVFNISRSLLHIRWSRLIAMPKAICAFISTSRTPLVPQWSLKWSIWSWACRTLTCAMIQW